MPKAKVVDRSARAKDWKPVEVTAETKDLATLRSDLVVVGAFQGVEVFHGVTQAVDEAIGGLLTRVLKTGDFSGKLKETLLVHPEAGSAKRVLLVGLGKVDEWSVDRARRVSAVVARKARELAVKTMHTAIHGHGSPHVTLDARVLAEAMAEGALLGLYEFGYYRGKNPEEKPKDKTPLGRIVLVDKDAKVTREARAGVETGVIIADATNQCRDWAMWASEEAAPARYGERAQDLARAHGLKAEVFDKKRITALGMGGLLAVNQGAAREPRFVILEHAPKNAKRTLVLVGKGITFDSGGISIKPSASMEDMKMDKCGASAVMGAVVAAARMNLPLRVIAIAPFTDNLPSGTAYKPGDIVTTLSGKTIEIVNTDAEGRVILSDALHYAGRYKPDAIVDLATLTGACPIAVGHHAIAGMGNDDPLMEAMRKAGAEVNERVWPLPFFDEYGEMVKSKVADVRNSAGRVASSITAGKFLEHFVGKHPWLHLDIASTAYHGGEAPKFNGDYAPEKATGVGVRLLVAWMRNVAAEPPAKTTKKAAKKPAKKAARKAARKA